ncbi:CHAT domain-containing protein [Pseudanabaena yagii]|uniref:CHAT domain-containing protein n=1 Tax=Pseudanabaena yagii GIHE-NHR1 TaxID=2722753 RepID=A0ABX1LQ14_9CYAN|nr:CHAT domain-containing protein [Pseudanabaena yagii]NMF57436.1 CHAT domain-containing protein [Pseudanabaena yagii GIHE-NHR1]
MAYQIYGDKRIPLKLLSFSGQCLLTISLVLGFGGKAIAQSTFGPPPPPPPHIPTTDIPTNTNIPTNTVDIVPVEANCERLVGVFCNPIELPPKETSDIPKIDTNITNALCAYSKTCSSAPSVSFNSIQEDVQTASKITDSQSWVIYPIIFDDHIELIVVPPSGKEIRKVSPNVKRDELTETVQSFLDSIRDPSSNDYLESSQKLYNWIIRPLDSDLKGAKVKTLIFVMDGSLRAIPIGALHDGNQFLVQKYATATVPSMGLANLKIPDRRNSKILVMGLTKATKDFVALPNVEVETKLISSKILTENADIFLDEKFTIENLKKQQNTKNYGIVHIASHAQFLSDVSDGAFIQFWNEKLKLSDLRTIRMGEEPIEMLTLSACQTAVGKNLGLSGTALIYRAKSVLASLWTVSDAGTTPLMLDFYNYYPKAKSKAIAIQQAQLDLLEGRVKIEGGKIKGIGNLPAISLSQVSGDINLKHPYFWASFILVGNWL